MLILRGAPALSAFRHGKLLAQLTEKVPAVSGLYAEFAHFAEVTGVLTGEEQTVLARLLKYGPSVPVQEPTGRLFLVVPRFGTISPWSSKATDIANNCGLAKVQRLERGIAYYVAGELSDAQAAEVRLFERLFATDQPEEGGRDFRENLNPHSKQVVTAQLEPSLAGVAADTRLQFERHGYFVADRNDHRPDRPVFNRITGLKDSRPR